MVKEELKEFLQVRQWFYQFFAEVLFEIPTKENMLCFMTSNLFQYLAEDVEVEGVSGLAESLAAMKGYDETAWKTLQAEHIALLAQSGPMKVYPWESVYTSREHIIYDEHTLAVKDFYAAWGITNAEPTRGPVDHIGLECSFIAVLTERAIKDSQVDDMVLRKNLTAQKEFLEQHLLVYVEAFSQRLAEQAESKLYSNLARFLPVYLAQDVKELSAILLK